MTDNNPTRKDVYREVLSEQIAHGKELITGYKDKTSKKYHAALEKYDNIDLKNITKECGTTFLETMAILSAAPYVIPTITRGIKDYRKDKTTIFDQKLDDTRYKNLSHDALENEMFFLKVASNAGILAGLGLDVAQLEIYDIISSNGHPEIWSIPIATNTASLIYEKVIRPTKNKVRNIREKRTNEHQQGNE